MEKTLICSFFGHSVVTCNDELYATALAEIWKSVNSGCRVFYFGGYGRFDEICHEIVTSIRKENPRLNVERVYCVSQERYLIKNVRYFNRADYERTIYLEPKYSGWYKSIYYRNCAMIDSSDYLIFYAENRENSGAYKALKYALKTSGKRIVNIADYLKTD